MKYRKKPIVIEAVLWEGKDVPASEAPEWLVDAVLSGDVVKNGDLIQIKTLEGVMIANIGDFIIQGVQKEIYPCKPDIFEKSYEPVTEQTEDSKRVHQAQEYHRQLEEKKKEIIELKKQLAESFLIYQNDQQEIARLKELIKEIFWGDIALTKSITPDSWQQFATENKI